MGYEKIKRPILDPQGMQIDGASTFSTAVTFRGAVTLSGTVTQSSAGYIAFDTESVTGATNAKTLQDRGVSFVTYGTSGKANDIIIPDPPAAGVLKHIFVTNNTTSVELNFNTAATSHTFWGTTYNTVTISAASTGSPGGTPAGTAALTLIAQSTTQWAIFPGSTFNWDFSASTGSTATA